MRVPTCTEEHLSLKPGTNIYSFIYTGDAILAEKCRLLFYLECGKYMSFGLVEERVWYYSKHTYISNH